MTDYYALLDGSDVAEDTTNLVLQYADLAEYLNGLLEDEKTPLAQQFWKDNAEIDTRRPGPPILDDVPELAEDYGLPIVRVKLSSSLTACLNELASRHKTVLATVVQAAWRILLFSMTRNRTNLLWRYSSGRYGPESKGCLGPLDKYLPVLCRLSEDLRFDEVLERVQNADIEAHRWRDYYAGTPDHIKSSIPRYCFAFCNARKEIRGGVARFLVERGEAVMDSYDLCLSCEPLDETLEMSLSWNPRFFSEQETLALADRLRQLLEEMAAEPGRRISELEMMGEQEQRQLLEEWNDTERELSGLKCVHEMFEEQVERTPGSVAVVYEDQRLTYEELNSRANQLAHYLRGLGVGPEVRVGICVERSVEMVVGLLGILKAGGAYVPLDPEYPAERLAYMVEDAQVPVLLTQSHLRERLPEGEARVVELDGEWPQIAEQSQEKVVCEVDLKNAAYVIYTSGSTGRPKGVVTVGRGLSNYVLAVSSTTAYPAGCRMDAGFNTCC